MYIYTFDARYIRAYIFLYEYLFDKLI